MLEPTTPRDHQHLRALRQTLRSLPNPRELALAVRRTVVGQDAAVRDLAVVMRQHSLRVRALEQGFPHVPRWRDTVLLIGPTGVGKTHMVRTFASVCGLPFHAEDCGRLSGTGYVGRSVADAVQELICAAGEDIYEAQCGILFLDELDKLRTQVSDGRDVRGSDVQTELLGLVEGRQLHLANAVSSRELRSGYAGSFETQHLCVIAAGAFEGLEEMVRERLAPGAGRMGFGPGSAATEASQMKRTDLLAHVTPDDLIAYGMRPELAGRLHTIIPLRELDNHDLHAILENEDSGPIARLRDAALLEGLRVEFAPDFAAAAVELACSAGLGARPLDSLVSRATRKAMFEVPGTAEPGSTLRFGAAALESGAYEVAAAAEGDVFDGPVLEHPPLTESGIPDALALVLCEDLTDEDLLGDDQGNDEADMAPPDLDSASPEDGGTDEGDEDALLAPVEADMKALRFLEAFSERPLIAGDRRTHTVVSALVSPELHDVARIVLLEAGVSILPRLLGLTGHPDRRRREAAAWVLGRLDHPVAQGMVAHMIDHDPEEDVRQYAGEQLGQFETGNSTGTDQQ